MKVKAQHIGTERGYKHGGNGLYVRPKMTESLFNTSFKSSNMKILELFFLYYYIYYEWYTKNEVKESKLRNKNTLFDTIILNNDTRLNDIIKKDYE